MELSTVPKNGTVQLELSKGILSQCIQHILLLWATYQLGSQHFQRLFGIKTKRASRPLEPDSSQLV